MPKWLNRIDIRFAHLADEEEARVPEVGKKVAERLRALSGGLKFPSDLTHETDKAWLEGEIDEIADFFEDAENFEDFNAALTQLYDLGDKSLATNVSRNFFNREKILWVEFASGRPPAEPAAAPAP